MLSILLTNIGITLFRSPMVALMGDLFPSDRRSVANGVINLMGGVGAISALVIGGILYGYGRLTPFIFGSLLMLAAISLVLLRIRERAIISPPEKDSFPLKFIVGLKQLFSRRHRPLLTLLLAILASSLATESVQTWISSFGVFNLGIEPGRISTLLGLSFALPSLLFAIPSGLMATRLGRKRTILIGYTIMLVLMVSGWFLQSEAMLVGILIPAGIASALIAVNALPLVYDVSGDDNRIGILTGLYYLANNLAAVAGPQVVGVFIELSGQNYRMMFLAAAIFMTLAVILLARIRMSDR
jgi:MFS family permease